MANTLGWGKHVFVCQAKAPLAASTGHGTLTVYIGMYAFNNDTAGNLNGLSNLSAPPSLVA